jgi:hypothetical protein
MISAAIENFQHEVPALANLKLVFELELRGRGDVQMFRVALPGPEITKAVADDSRVTVSIERATFNELAANGRVSQYIDAYEAGNIKTSGDPGIQKLIAQVVQKRAQRSRTRKVH